MFEGNEVKSVWVCVIRWAAGGEAPRTVKATSEPAVPRHPGSNGGGSASVCELEMESRTNG